MDVGIDSLAVKVALNPGHGMDYHSHDRRDEGWTVISGSGSVVIDGEERLVSAGDVIDLHIGCKHTGFALDFCFCFLLMSFAYESGLQIGEVQIGADVRVEDKRKLSL